MRTICFLLLIVLTLFPGCDSKQDRLDSIRLQRLDSQMQGNPQKVMDSLTKIGAEALSRTNHGHYLLLDVVAKDKTNFIFRSDSLIVLASKILSKSKNDRPLLYARSLLYCGIVRHRMGINDSTAYEPIKHGIDFLKEKKIKNPLFFHLCYYYLGLIHTENNSMEYGAHYLKKAIETAKRLKNKRFLFNAYRDIAWTYMQMKKYDSVETCIDSLGRLAGISTSAKADRNYLLSVYYERTNNPRSALAVNQKLREGEIARNQNLSSIHYKISKDYLKLQALDSALLYAEKARREIADTSFYQNYSFYANIGEISAKMDKWQQSALAYQKAYELRDKAVSKELDTRIMELEKKYDLAEAQNKALEYRNRIVLISLASLAAVILLVSAVIILVQRQHRTKMKAVLAEQKNELLHQQTKNMERELIDKEFLLPLYQQVSQRNAAVKALLSDLKTNTHVSKNQQLASKIAETYADFVGSTALHPESFLSESKFEEFTGIRLENADTLNANEKMLLVLSCMKLDNRQIAILFNTSESGIRGRKAKLRAKIETLGMDANGIDL